MPIADKPTWLRDPTDIDWDEEGAWLIAAPYVATPMLLMAARELIRVTNGESDRFRRAPIQSTEINPPTQTQAQ